VKWTIDLAHKGIGNAIEVGVAVFYSEEIELSIVTLCMMVIIPLEVRIPRADGRGGV
jgi:hypothetical protein